MADLEVARKTAERLATSYLGVQEQTDTYFHCPQGRLKLREIVDYGHAARGRNGNTPKRSRTELISYDRLNEYEGRKKASTSASKLPIPARLQQIEITNGNPGGGSQTPRSVSLSQRADSPGRSREPRERWREFEAVLGGSIDAVSGRAQVALLEDEFSIDLDDLVKARTSICS